MFVLPVESVTEASLDPRFPDPGEEGGGLRLRYGVAYEMEMPSGIESTLFPGLVCS